jgi:hypothetical protein
LEHPWTGRTLLHEIASHGPPQQGSKHQESWNYLIKKITECEVWSVYQFQFILLVPGSIGYILNSCRNSKNSGYNANRRRNSSRKVSR